MDSLIKNDIKHLPYKVNIYGQDFNISIIDDVVVTVHHQLWKNQVGIGFTIQEAIDNLKEKHKDFFENHLKEYRKWLSLSTK